MTGQATGHCLCGAVCFEFEHDAGQAFHCHCESCRRAASSPVTTWVTVPTDKARFTKGEPTYFTSSPGVRRGFCGTCGSPLSYEGPVHPGFIDLYAASLEPDVVVEPEFHVYCNEQLPWFEVHDDLPRYGGSISSGKPPVRKGPRNS